MKIATAFNKILGLLPEISASELGRRGEVNKGQLSTFLNKDGSLAEDKQANLVQFLLQMLDEMTVPAETQKKLTPLLSQLKEFPAYRIKWGEADADPFQHILFGWQRYIERDVEQEIIAYMARRPFVLGITSGPKTGKSSIARRVRHEAGKQGAVVYLDCRLYATAGNTGLVEWLFQCASQQLAQVLNHHPSDWVSMVAWLKHDVLTEKKACTFIFDHMEELGDAYAELSSGWHYVLNQTRDEPALKALGLVLVYDPASPAMFAAQTHASRLEQRMKAFVPENYAKGQVERLFKAIFADEAAQSAHKAMIDEVWEMFQGHPFLTHVFAHTYANSKPAIAQESAQAAAQRAFTEHIAPILLSNAYKTSLAQHFSSPTSESAGIKVAANHALHLHDTGLFFEQGVAENACLHCTPWVHARLQEAFRIGANDEQPAN